MTQTSQPRCMLTREMKLPKFVCRHPGGVTLAPWNESAFICVHLRLPLLGVALCGYLRFLGSFTMMNARTGGIVLDVANALGQTRAMNSSSES